MVRGIAKFREAFSEYSGNYVIIGGSACEVHEENAGQTPRATRDIDIIVIVEALSHNFVARFWKFVADAGYKEKQVGEKGTETRHQYYRFKNPSDSGFPAQVELFSRSLGIFELPEDLNVTPIPTDSDLSSLSAILLDDAYYHYTIEHSIIVEEVHIANIESLVALKCKAYLEMNRSKALGEQVDSKHIRKHRNDVFRLVGAIRSAEESFPLPQTLYNDVAAFCEAVREDLPDSNLIKDMGLRRIKPEDLFDRLTALFTIEQ